jgi:hypothetical protein
VSRPKRSESLRRVVTRYSPEGVSQMFDKSHYGKSRHKPLISLHIASSILAHDSAEHHIWWVVPPLEGPHPRPVAPGTRLGEPPTGKMIAMGPTLSRRTSYGLPR